jgi:hypothetical protein
MEDGSWLVLRHSSFGGHPPHLDPLPQTTGARRIPSPLLCKEEDQSEGSLRLGRQIKCVRPLVRSGWGMANGSGAGRPGVGTGSWFSVRGSRFTAKRASVRARERGRGVYTAKRSQRFLACAAIVCDSPVGSCKMRNVEKWVGFVWLRSGVFTTNRTRKTRSTRRTALRIGRGSESGERREGRNYETNPIPAKGAQQNM